MKNQGDFGFVLKVNKYNDFKNPITYKATIGLEVEEINEEKNQLIFSYQALTHYDEVYNKAIEFAVNYLLKQTISFSSLKINITHTYWFDLQGSPPVAVAYAAYFALYKALAINLPFQLKPSFDVFGQHFVFPNIDSSLLSYEVLAKEYEETEELVLV